MCSLTTLIGVILLVLGIAGFSYKYFTYTTEEKVAQIGDVKISATDEKAVVVPPLLSGGLVVGGLILIVVGVANRKA